MTLVETGARRPARRRAAAPLHETGPPSARTVFARLARRLPRAEDNGPEEVARLLGPATRGRSWIAAFLNAHAFNLSAADPAARAAFEGADLLLRDGAGAALLMRLAGRDPGVNANGTDLIPRLACAAGARVAIYGGRPGVAEAAAAALRARGADIVAARHGYHPLPAYEAWIARDAAPRAQGGGGATLVILGMGAPRQEALALRLRACAPAPVGILCGGGVLDFLSGRARRAPRWMRACGLEWLFRLGREPRRLFRRYVIGNPLFMLRALAAARRARAETGGDRQSPAIGA